MRILFVFLTFTLFFGSPSQGAFSVFYYPMDGKNGELADKQGLTIQDISEKFLFSGESALRRFSSFRGSKSLSYLYLPVTQRERVGEIFGLAPGAISERGWMVLLKARTVVPVSGKYRLIGLGDDVLVARVNGKAALDARGSFYPPEDYKLKVEYLSLGAGSKKRNLRAGPWINLSRGAPLSLEALIGGVGSTFNSYLLVEHLSDKGIPSSVGEGTYSLLSFDEGVTVEGVQGGDATEGVEGLNPPISSIFAFARQTEGFNGGSSPVKRVDEVELQDGPSEDNDPRWEGDFHLQSVPAGKFRGVLSGWYRPVDRGAKWEFQVPHAPETAGQKKVTSYFAHGGTKLTEKVVDERGVNMTKQAFLQAEFRTGARDDNAIFQVDLVYEAELFRQRLVAGSLTGGQSPEKLTGGERRQFLSLAYPFDVNRRSIRKWIDDNGLRRFKGERDLAFASRVQSFMVSYFSYNADRRMSLEDALRYRGIACGESAFLFGGIMRMHDIPARTRAGRWTQTQQRTPDGGEDIKVHVKVDFYAEGVGWVVVEFPYGEKDPQKVAECIGLDGDFFTMQIDPFVTRSGGFIFDQGFRGYIKGTIQPLAYEWWNAETKAPLAR